MIARMPTSSAGTLVCLALRRRVRRDGRSSASSPTARARPSARCSRSASRSLRRCSGRSCSPAAASRRRLRALPAPRRRRRPRARRRRLRAAGRLLLRRAVADRRVAARAAALHVPGDGRGRRGRCSAASAWTPAARAALALALGGARARRGGRRGGRARPVGTALGLAAAVVYSDLHPRRRGGSPRASAPGVLSALVCTGAAVSLTAGSAAARRVPPGRAHGRRVGLDRRPRASSRRCRDRPASSPACAASARTPRRSSRRSSPSSRCCSRSRLRRDARARADRRRRARARRRGRARGAARGPSRP